ncbi:hypothetical protein [Pseudomonas sp. 34 E 7]|nr:hypothetical protein [Pseudomonas sp. 34 E 7]
MLQARQLTQLGKIRPAALVSLDLGAGDHRGTQVLHDFTEKRIAGGFGDQLVEAFVFFHAAVVVGQAGPIVVQRLAHMGQLRVGTAQRGQRHRLHLQTQAQFQHVAHAGDGVDVQAQALPGVLLQHERADAVPRLHQPRRLQLGDGFAYHRAAHPMLKHDGGFGRQFFARFELAEQDALGQRVDHALGQVGGASAHGRCVFNGHR